MITESGLVGAALVAAYLVYLFQRLGVARRLGLVLVRAGDTDAVLLRALAWGITAAVAGTMAANFFYLTMQMYYFTGLVALALAVPLVLARRARAAPQAPRWLGRARPHPHDLVSAARGRLRGPLPRRLGRAPPRPRARGRPPRAGPRVPGLRARLRRGHVPERPPPPLGGAAAPHLDDACRPRAARKTDVVHAHWLPAGFPRCSPGSLSSSRCMGPMSSSPGTAGASPGASCVAPPS